MIVISFQKELNRVDDRTTPEQDPALRSAMLGLARGEQTEKYMTLHSRKQYLWNQGCPHM